MDREMRKVRRMLLHKMREDTPDLQARDLVVVKGRDGAYTGWIKEREVADGQTDITEKT